MSSIDMQPSREIQLKVRRVGMLEDGLYPGFPVKPAHRKFPDTEPCPWRPVVRKYPAVPIWGTIEVMLYNILISPLLPTPEHLVDIPPEQQCHTP